MKKVLYGTTALVAAGVLGTGSAEAQIQLGLGGYMNTFFSVASIDEASGNPADYNATGLWSDGEVHFKGSYKHDNGITFGAEVQLEMFSGGDQIDEKFMFISGDFGRLVAGSENSAAYIMHYAAPSVGLPINSGWVTVFIPPTASHGGLFRSPGGSTYLDFGNDENVITYYTPRFSGFQLGVTYAPTVNGSGDGKNFPVEADTETEYHNGFAAGLNFVEDFNGFGVAVSAGWRYAQASEAAETLGADDYQAISFGGQLSYGGFTVGGSYANEYDGLYTDFGGGYVVSTEGESWDVGASYSIGPWTFGVTYFQGEHEGEITNGDEDEFQALQGGLNYALGPGISLGAGVMWAEYDTEDGAEQSGIAGAVGLTFSF